MTTVPYGCRAWPGPSTRLRWELARALGSADLELLRAAAIAGDLGHHGLMRFLAGLSGDVEEIEFEASEGVVTELFRAAEVAEVRARFLELREGGE